MDYGEHESLLVMNVLNQVEVYGKGYQADNVCAARYSDPFISASPTGYT